MSESRSAFALLHPHWVLPIEIQLPYKLSDSVSSAIEEEGVEHCIVVDYQSLAIERPWPPADWSEDDKGDQTARLAHFILWLACPTQLTFTTIVLADTRAVPFAVKRVTGYVQTYPTPPYSTTNMTPKLCKRPKSHSKL